MIYLEEDKLVQIRDKIQNVRTLVKEGKSTKEISEILVILETEVIKIKKENKFIELGL